jgi:hypothetical protein
MSREVHGLSWDCVYKRSWFHAETNFSYSGTHMAVSAMGPDLVHLSGRPVDAEDDVDLLSHIYRSLTEIETVTPAEFDDFQLSKAQGDALSLSLESWLSSVPSVLS